MTTLNTKTTNTFCESMTELRQYAVSAGIDYTGLTIDELKPLVEGALNIKFYNTIPGESVKKPAKKVIKKPVKKVVKKQYTLKELCEEIGIEPKAARRTLRKIRGANNVAYVFTSDEAKKVIKGESFEVLA